MAKAAVKQVSPAPAPQSAPEQEAPSPPKKKRKLVLILAAALAVLLVAGVAAAWFLMSHKAADDEHQDEKPASTQPPVFVNLEPFTVNLQPDQGEQFLQVSAVLRVEDARASEDLKLYMPEIRHRVLMLLSSKTASDISSVQGRESLSNEMRDETNRILGVASGKLVKRAEKPKPSGAGSADARSAIPPPMNGPVKSVLFTSFIIQ